MTATIADLQKRSLADERRDKDGKWTAGGGGAKAPAGRSLADERIAALGAPPRTPKATLARLERVTVDGSNADARIIRQPVPERERKSAQAQVDKHVALQKSISVPLHFARQLVINGVEAKDLAGATLAKNSNMPEHSTLVLMPKTIAASLSKIEALDDLPKQIGNGYSQARDLYFSVDMQVTSHAMVAKKITHDGAYTILQSAIVDHELGHVYANAHPDVFAEFNDIPHRQALMSELSLYATSNQSEGFAESYSAYVNGFPQPKEFHDFFAKALGGNLEKVKAADDADLPIGYVCGFGHGPTVHIYADGRRETIEAPADGKAETGTIADLQKKFDPSEARDRTGEWTQGGVGPGALDDAARMRDARIQAGKEQRRRAAGTATDAYSLDDEDDATHPPQQGDAAAQGPPQPAPLEEDPTARRRRYDAYGVSTDDEDFEGEQDPRFTGIGGLVEGWSINQAHPAATKLRMMANVVAGRAPRALIQPYALERFDAASASISNDDMAKFKAYQQQNAAAFDALHPEGATLLRGTGERETAALMKAPIGSTITTMQSLLSTTSSDETARLFANSNEEGEGIIEFQGVRGQHVFDSQELHPRIFTEDESETVLMGTGKWKLKSKSKDADGVLRFVLAPEDDRG